MKRKEVLGFIGACMVMTALLTACEGPAGPAGAAGEKGDTGATGPTGPAGPAGLPGNEAGGAVLPYIPESAGLRGTVWTEIDDTAKITYTFSADGYTVVVVSKAFETKFDINDEVVTHPLQYSKLPNGVHTIEIEDERYMFTEGTTGLIRIGQNNWFMKIGKGVTTVETGLPAGLPGTTWTATGKDYNDTYKLTVDIPAGGSTVDVEIDYDVVGDNTSTFSVVSIYVFEDNTRIITGKSTAPNSLVVPILYYDGTGLCDFNRNLVLTRE